MEKKQQNTQKRDALIQLEEVAQKIWQEQQFFQANKNENNKKFFVTFPYPYMNGKLHLGHAFSMTKCEFQVRYKRLQGYNVLWPFSFHCTGMPISAAAKNLDDQLKLYGNPPKMPEDFKGKSQFAILEQMNIAKEEIPKFTDPYYWLSYFPPLGKKDLIRFGIHCDWRRSFITTDANPYYNSFIEWQFEHLKENNHISFGKRPSIFSVKDQQMCADHDRLEGEGINPQEYTLIKLKIKEFPQALEQIKNREVYLVAATLRPETMYGQTNCFVKPEGVYGAFEMKNNQVYICSERSAKNMAYQELTRVSQKVEKILDIKGTDLIGVALSAPLTTYDTVYALPMLSISMDKGTGIVTSVPSDAPDDYATLRDLQKKPAFRQKYNLQDFQVLPFECLPIIEIPNYSTLSAQKACEEFKVNSQNDQEPLKKAKDKVYLKGFYDGIMLVGDFKGQNVQIAKPLVKQKLLDSNQADNYYEPEGLVVSRSGDQCIVALVDQWYLTYSDENWKNQVHQWVKGQHPEAEKIGKFQCYNDTTLKLVSDTVDWLKEWGCSRSFGLGTKMPWDKQFLIESLSDSTIYMAYYTIAHFLQSSFNGDKMGSLEIKPEEVSKHVWDYVFLGKEYNQQCQVPENKLKIMRDEFNYWYPMDLRCSGKDLIKNHLTMCLFNHASIWKDDLLSKMPRGFFCNGHVLVDNVKMSKSLGNFYTMEQIIEKYGADASRVALADAGDFLDDGNFSLDTSDNAVLNLFTLMKWMRETKKSFSQLRTKSVNEKTKFYDEVFQNQIKLAMIESIAAYEKMRFRDVLKCGFFELQNMKDEYKILVGDDGLNKNLIFQYIQFQLLILYPITPHFCETLYQEVFLELVEDKQQYPQYISNYHFPKIQSEEINHTLIKQYEIMKYFLRQIRLSFEKAKKGNSKSKKTQEEKQLTKCYIIYASGYYDWQKNVLEILEKYSDENLNIDNNWKQEIKNDKNLSTEMQKKSMQFGSFVVGQIPTRGKEALEKELPFNEQKLYDDNRDLIMKEIQGQEIIYLNIDAAQKSLNKSYGNIIQQVIPGKAQIIFE